MPGTSPIRLKPEAYLELAEAHGHRTYDEQAKAARLGFGSIWRARHGEPVGGKVIHALTTLYGVGFDDLFTMGATATTRVKDAS